MIYVCETCGVEFDVLDSPSDLYCLGCWPAFRSILPEGDS